MKNTSEPDEIASSGLLSFETLTRRKDFLRASRGNRVHVDGFVLQGWNRGDTLPPRMGYTCSKKVGNAVARNRAKRRLRAIARDVLPSAARLGWDYVLIGRAGITADLPYSALTQQLNSALKTLGKK